MIVHTMFRHLASSLTAQCLIMQSMGMHLDCVARICHTKTMGSYCLSTWAFWTIVLSKGTIKDYYVYLLQVEAIETRCLQLFARDYKYSIIQNTNGEVCGHYPRQIVFLEYECLDVEKDRYISTAQSSHPFSPDTKFSLVTNYPLVCLCASSSMHTLLWCGDQRSSSVCSPSEHIKEAEG